MPIRFFTRSVLVDQYLFLEPSGFSWSDSTSEHFAYFPGKYVDPREKFSLVPIHDRKEFAVYEVFILICLTDFPVKYMAG